MSGDIDAEMQDKEEGEEEDQEGSDEEDKGEEDNLETQAGKDSFCYPIIIPGTELLHFICLSALGETEPNKEGLEEDIWKDEDDDDDKLDKDNAENPKSEKSDDKRGSKEEEEEEEKDPNQAPEESKFDEKRERKDEGQDNEEEEEVYMADNVYNKEQAEVEPEDLDLGDMEGDNDEANMNDSSDDEDNLEDAKGKCLLCENTFSILTITQILTSGFMGDDLYQKDITASVVFK